MTAQKIDYKAIATMLTGGDPLKFRTCPDGSLVVIAYTGKKHKFTPDQIEAALPKPAPKPAPKKQPATKAKTSQTPRKASNKKT